MYQIYGGNRIFKNQVDSWPLPFAAKYTLLHFVSKGNLKDFKPMDESKIDNPLPGEFHVGNSANGYVNGQSNGKRRHI